MLNLIDCHDLTSVETDERPGDYFVSAVDHGKLALASGPYHSHAVAKENVVRIKQLVESVDPKAFWYAFGTARMEPGSGKVGFVEKYGLGA